MMTALPPPPAPPGGPGRPERPGRPSAGRNLAGLLLAVVALAVMTAAFGLAISLDRAGPCHVGLSHDPGRPHYVMVCGKP